MVGSIRWLATVNSIELRGVAGLLRRQPGVRSRQHPHFNRTPCIHLTETSLAIFRRLPLFPRAYLRLLARTGPGLFLRSSLIRMNRWLPARSKIVDIWFAAPPANRNSPHLTKGPRPYSSFHPTRFFLPIVRIPSTIALEARPRPLSSCRKVQTSAVSRRHCGRDLR